MMEKCRRGRIDLILTKSVSRFARNTLNCLEYVRKLRERDIGIYFEKEGIHTLEADETLLTIMASMAQSESESISRNVHLVFQQSFKAGKVPWGFLYGYRKDENGQPVIHAEEGEVVKRIFYEYHGGKSLLDIKKMLEAEGILSPKGKELWTESTLASMLSNEKYIGDVLLQKTFVADMLTKTVKKNNGELPQYYVENNHEGIISKALFNEVQVEIARRNSKRADTRAEQLISGRAKYTSKHALTELLICSHCGTNYRRVTWTRPEGKKVVWRCVNRLTHGKKVCPKSATVEEILLHDAIVDALNRVVSKEQVQQALYDSITSLADGAPTGLEAEMETLISSALQALPAYDDRVVRQAISQIAVLDKDTIRIKFRDGIEITKQLAYSD